MTAKTTTVKSKKKRYNYLYAVGRRKTATARVRFYKNNEKTGRVVINEKAHSEYFSTALAKIVEDPIKLIATPLEGYFTVKVSGGGSNAQAQAVRHGISRILIQINEDWRAALRQKGYLTRDSRMKERKKPGLKRARRAPQWSKR